MYTMTGAGAVTLLARRKTLLVLAQCTPQLALETRTLQEQARRNRRQAHVQPLFRSAQAPWCGALPTVRGKQLSDRRCPLDPGEHEEAECEFSTHDRSSSNLPVAIT